MAITWSRISSKVMVTPLYADAAWSRRCEHGQSRSGSLYRIWWTKESRKAWEARDAEVMPCSQRRGGLCHESFDRLSPPQTPRESGVHHVAHPTTHQKTR